MRTPERPPERFGEPTIPKETEIPDDEPAEADYKLGDRRPQLRKNLRTCIDCAHWAFESYDDGPFTSCMKGHYRPYSSGQESVSLSWTSGELLREALKTAADCEDFQERPGGGS